MLSALVVTYLAIGGWVVAEMQGQAALPAIASPYHEVWVTVHKGQTAWTIQQAFTPRANLKAMLQMDEQLNHRNMAKIDAGDTLLFIQ
jgi:hypothetical protein